jgi:hypothetical protein
MQDDIRDASQSEIPWNVAQNDLSATVVGDAPTRFSLPNFPTIATPTNGWQPLLEPDSPVRAHVASRGLSRSTSRSFSLYNIQARPVRTPSAGLQIVEGVPDLTQPSLASDRFSASTDNLDDRFTLNEAQRQQEFLQGDEHRNSRFSDAEATKDGAETRRTHVFGQREHDRDQNFQVMLSIHWNSFHGLETSWGSAEFWRTQQSQAAEEDRTQSFGQTLNLIQKQYCALDTLEVDALQSMKRRITKGTKLHYGLCEQGCQQQDAAFSISQARRKCVPRLTGLASLRYLRRSSSPPTGFVSIFSTNHILAADK